MDKQAFFWKIMAGELPPPKAATTLGIVFKHIDADVGTIEVELQGKPEFTNPAENIQGGFLAAMLDDAMGPALATTLKEGQFAPALIAHERSTPTVFMHSPNWARATPRISSARA